MECDLIKLSELDVQKQPTFIILLLTGLPGSGKTTLCHTLPYILGNKYHILHVCFDHVVQFREEWSDEGSCGMWKSERAKVLLAVEELIKHFLLDQEVVETDVLVQNENSKLRAPTDVHVAYTEKPKLSEKMLDGLNYQDRVLLNSKDVSGLDMFLHDAVARYSTLDLFKLNKVSVNHNFVDSVKLQNKLVLFCVDDNFYYHSMRKEWWNLAAKYGLAFSTLVVSCAIDLCIERVRERTCLQSQLDIVNVPIDVIKRMSERFELPDQKLYQWEKYCSVVDTSDLNVTSTKMPGFSFTKQYVVDETSMQEFSKIKKLLFDSLLDPAKPLLTAVNSGCSIATPNLIHRVDLILRKIVGRSDKSLKAFINKRRKDILEDLKKGSLNIPNDLADEEDVNKERLEKYVATLIDV